MTGMLSEQVCLVTGASRGIGQAIALAFAREGGTVYGTATTGPGAAGIEKAFAEAGLDGYGRVLNVNDAGGITDLVKEITDRSGTPAILVNNAGIIRDNLMLRMRDDEWEDVVRTNMTSVFRVSRAVLRGMVRVRHGRIINISSVVGTTGNAGQANYAATKAGMIGFTKSLALEVAARGITVNAISPGFIETDMTAALNDEQRAAMMREIPLKRFGLPQDIAGAALFLASCTGNYITGQTLHVNGGLCRP